MYPAGNRPDLENQVVIEEMYSYFRDVPEYTFELAIREFVKCSDQPWFPSVGQLLDVAEKVQKELEKAYVEKAKEAFKQFDALAEWAYEASSSEILEHGDRAKLSVGLDDFYPSPGFWRRSGLGDLKFTSPTDFGYGALENLRNRELKELNP